MIALELKDKYEQISGEKIFLNSLLVKTF